MLGSIDDYPFQFRVHEKNSPRYGIEGGRILKLQVSDKGSKMPLFVYERGWLRKPSTPEQQELLNALLHFADTLPNWEVWKRRGAGKWFTFFVDEENVLEVEPDNLI